MPVAIVFDLDGTLVDSAPDLQAAVNKVLADYNQPALSLAKVTSFIGNGIPNLVHLARLECGLPVVEEEQMKARMLAYYSADPAGLTRPYPGVIAALAMLRRAGHRLGVCTNKFHAPSVQILDALHLSDFFEVVIGGDSLPVKKPDPAPLFAAFQGLNAQTGFYIGDSEIDAETAERAEIPFGLYTCGYRKTAAEALTTCFTFDDYAALAPAILGYSKG
jgi:phosphoglycolate phosphatase